MGAILFTGSRIFGNENILIKYWILVIRYCHDTLQNTLQVDKKYLDKHKTWFILFKRQCLYLNVDADEHANANAKMPMQRFLNGQSLSSIKYYFSMHLTLKSRKVINMVSIKRNTHIIHWNIFSFSQNTLQTKSLKKFNLRKFCFQKSKTLETTLIWGGRGFFSEKKIFYFFSTVLSKIVGYWHFLKKMLEIAEW